MMRSILLSCIATVLISSCSSHDMLMPNVKAPEHIIESGGQDKNKVEKISEQVSKFGIIKNHHPDIKFLALQADWKIRDTSGVYGVYTIRE